MENTTTIIAHYADAMIKKIGAVKTIAIPQPKTIQINDICHYTEENCNADFVNLGNNIIYIINAGELQFNYEHIKTEFTRIKTDYKAKGKEYHVSHINDQAHWENRSGNSVLYVGSARSNAKGRFKQHLGLSLNESRGTYALYLKDWWPSNNPLSITYFPFGDTIDTDSLQIIEDSLWEEHKPLFGKKGGRNL